MFARTLMPALAGSMVCAGAFAATPCLLATFALAGDLEGFDGGSASYTNPGGGGVDGVVDGYLEIENFEAAFLGVRHTAPEWTGDFITAGIVRVTVWLNDVGADDNLELHLIVGRAFGNAWQHNQPLRPVPGEWRKFSVDISLDENDWTPVVGSGTLEDALRNGDRIAFRHDVAPYTPFPEAVAGAVGMDNVRLIGSACDCPQDVNDDGMVNFTDLNFVLGGFNQTGDGLPGDVNFSGAVTFDDLNLVLGVYNQPCP